MRVVFTGAEDPTVKAAKELSEKGHEVILIEENEKKIHELRAELDCGIIQGDGTNPEVLQETNPKTVDFLISLTDSDQANIITGLVGKSQGFRNVIVSVRNPLYEKICVELGLENTIMPSRTISRSLIDFVEHEYSPELEDYIKKDARLYKFVIEKESTLVELDLPENVKGICFYRDDHFYLIHDNTHFKAKDEIILLTSKGEISNLEKKFLPSS